MPDYSQGEQSKEWDRSSSTKGPDEFRNMARPVDYPEIVIWKNAQLKATPTRVRPGESILLEASFDSSAQNLGESIIILSSQRGAKNVPLKMERVRDRYYSGTLTFNERDSGVFDYSVWVSDMQNKAKYISDTLKVAVAPDVRKQKLLYMEISDLSTLAVAGTKNPLYLYAYDLKAHNREEERYDLTLPAVGTEYRFEDESLAAVTEDGFLHALAPGKTVLHATYQSLSASLEVRIEPPHIWPPAPKINPAELPAASTVLSPADGAVVERDTKVFFEVTPFDTSKGHGYDGSDWIVLDERGRKRAYLSNNSEKATWIPPLSGKYKWRVRHFYKGAPFAEDDSYTPWTTVIVVPNSQDVKGK
jgi:hypothetical protein